jgi:7-cyano-7-deazaguanine synthase
VTAGSRPAGVVLLSGGLDSATVLALATEAGFASHCLSFDYGQRHDIELQAARRVARQLNAQEHRVIKLDLRVFGGSALTDDIEVPKGRAKGAIDDDAADARVPVTYVPARNTIFLSYALAYAEVSGARDLWIGANQVDFSGYPDCRPAFIEACEALANVATAHATAGPTASDPQASARIRVRAPLMDMDKAAIIKRGTALGVDYGLTHSCYDPAPHGVDEALACGACDACVLRREGFAQAGVDDPTRYVADSEV